MKTASGIGLVAAGAVSSSFLARLRHVMANLGPVKASSYRVASRISNRLKAGHAARSFDEFDRTRVVLISVPDAYLAATVEELADSGLRWRGKAVILCGSARDSGDLEPLSAQEACTASLTVIEPESRWYVAEGHRRAVSAARHLVSVSGTMLEIPKGAKPVFLGGLVLLGNFLVSHDAAAMACFRRAGLRPGAAARLMEFLQERALRTFLKSGPRVRAGTLADPPESIIERMDAQLEGLDPALSRYLLRCREIAADYLERGERTQETPARV